MMKGQNFNHQQLEATIAGSTNKFSASEQQQPVNGSLDHNDHWFVDEDLVEDEEEEEEEEDEEEEDVTRKQHHNHHHNNHLNHNHSIMGSLMSMMPFLLQNNANHNHHQQHHPLYRFHQQASLPVQQAHAFISSPALSFMQQSHAPYPTPTSNNHSHARTTNFSIESILNLSKNPSHHYNANHKPTTETESVNQEKGCELLLISSPSSPTTLSSTITTSPNMTSPTTRSTYLLKPASMIDNHPHQHIDPFYNIFKHYSSSPSSAPSEMTSGLNDVIASTALPGTSPKASSINTYNNTHQTTKLTKRRPINRGPRIPFTPSQVQELESKFNKTQYLSSLEVNQLAKRLNLSDTRVRIWFQNRRAREKREHSNSPAGPDQDRISNKSAKSSAHGKTSQNQTLNDESNTSSFDSLTQGGATAQPAKIIIQPNVEQEEDENNFDHPGEAVAPESHLSDSESEIELSNNKHCPF